LCYQLRHMQCEDLLDGCLAAVQILAIREELQQAVATAGATQGAAAEAAAARKRAESNAWQVRQTILPCCVSAALRRIRALAVSCPVSDDP